MNRADALNRYVNENAGKIEKRFRPKYHFSSPIGWINDPNGFVYAYDKIHLFSQFFPFATHWGHISWGHAVSDDFVKWKWMPVAIAPEEAYEEGIGIMSGSSLFEKDKLVAFYACGSTINDIEKQQMAFAVSVDGVNFVRNQTNPVIRTEDIPDGFSKVHFRDPKIFKVNDNYYLLITSKDNNDCGQLLLYRAKNYTDWTYVGAVIKKKFNMNGAFECPDYFTLDGHDIILCSPQFLKSADGDKHQNVHSSVYMIGKMNLEKADFSLESFDDIDSGTDFYAPQTLVMPDGRRVMIAWMNNWDKDYPSRVDGWVGSMILPRELTIKNNKLYQKPIKEIERYWKNEVVLQNLTVDKETFFEQISGNQVDFEFEVDVTACLKFGVKFFADSRYCVDFYYNKNTSTAYVNRKFSGLEIESTVEQEANIRFVKVCAPDNVLKIRFLLDVTCAEIFMQDGERTMALTAFPPTLASGIKFYAEGGNAAIKRLVKRNIALN